MTGRWGKTTGHRTKRQGTAPCRLCLARTLRVLVRSITFKFCDNVPLQRNDILAGCELPMGYLLVATFTGATRKLPFVLLLLLPFVLWKDNNYCGPQSVIVPSQENARLGLCQDTFINQGPLVRTHTSTVHYYEPLAYLEELEFFLKE